jgi:hypothetical protein
MLPVSSAATVLIVALLCLLATFVPLRMAQRRLEALER